MPEKHHSDGLASQAPFRILLRWRYVSRFNLGFSWILNMPTGSGLVFMEKIYIYRAVFSWRAWWYFSDTIFEFLEIAMKWLKLGASFKAWWCSPRHLYVVRWEGPSADGLSRFYEAMFLRGNCGTGLASSEWRRAEESENAGKLKVLYPFGELSAIKFPRTFWEDR